MPDAVNHPSHYTSHPSGVEAVDVTEHLSFNLGNCVKYLLRRQHKGREIEDLQKAEWYASRELTRPGLVACQFSPPPGLLDRVVRIASSEPNKDVGLAIGLLATAAWSGNPHRTISSAIKILEEEVDRVESPFSGLRPVSREEYA
jgi:hypothetical protein